MDGHKRFLKAIEKTPGGQREVATVLGVSEATISRIVDGSRNPTLWQARAIQDLWGVPMDSWVPKTHMETMKVVTRG